MAARKWATQSCQARDSPWLGRFRAKPCAERTLRYGGGMGGGGDVEVKGGVWRGGPVAAAPRPAEGEGKRA